MQVESVMSLINDKNIINCSHLTSLASIFRVSSLLLMVFSHTALMLICAMFIFHSAAFASKVGFGHGKFNVGLTVGAFPNVDQREAQAAMQLWTNQLALGMGIKAEPRTKLYSNNNELLHDVNNGELSVVSIPALDYIQIRKSARMSPVLVSAGND
jgi:hypothetical protein